jgi:transposase
MVTDRVPASQPPSSPCRRIGVGVDTSRYGHYAAFLREDLQPAAAELLFTESAQGYAQLRQRLEQIAQRHGHVHFVVRLDAAGQYADNLLHFLHGLGTPAELSAPAPADAAPLALSLSCGDPQRNKNYRAALFGNKKSDPLEARAAARFALSERPAATAPLPQALRTLRQVACRLQAVVRQRTRLLNQLHHLVALTFPELALLVKDLSTGWVLELLHRYPTAALLAGASETQLGEVPYLPDAQITALLQQARGSIASLSDATAAELVRDQVRQLREVRARQQRLEKLLVSAYRSLPAATYLDSIPGIGAVTAAVLSAFILDIDRFPTPGQLVAYFGVVPIEASSGVDRDGQPRGPKRFVMSRRGNDLVRRYLWMAALSAVRHNPAVRALYARVVAKHPQHKAIAIGHAMRKLLHLVFAVWKTNKPFDPEHYPWPTPAHVEEPEVTAEAAAQPESDNQTAGHQRSAKPARKVVTAAWTDRVAAEPVSDDRTAIDFAHLKRQLPMARVLDQLGLSSRLRGAGPQRRCPCPIHRGDTRGRTFSVHLDQGVFQCFDPSCGTKGDVIDLWASVRGLSLREAALDLVRTFALEPVPRPGTEKRPG